MSDSDYVKGARRGQDQSPQLPAVIPGGLYTRQQLINNLHISAHKIIAWENAGLEFVRTGATEASDKGKLYFADDVLHFIKTLKGG